ncbi:MAG: hypothetical protein C0404_07425 [Verrucomicrobia bacterium]|nr:hypothetical protein [Verrucomicrobiota bacterium]
MSDDIGHEMPEALAKQLQGFGRRLRMVETVTAFLAGATGLLVAYLLLFALDRFWDTPGWLRFVLMAGGGGTALVLGYRWVMHWQLSRPGARDLARRVRKLKPQLGDRLLGAVELAEGNGSSNTSAALRRAAIRQVAQEVARYDLAAAVPTKPGRRWAVPFAAGLMILVIAALLCPLAAGNALRRFLLPLSGVERYTFASIEALPAELHIPHGEEFEICCKLSSVTRWRPANASAQFERQPEIRARIEQGVALLRMPGQTKPGNLRVRTGDALRTIRVIPLFRPELTALRAEVVLPQYLGRKAQLVDITAPAVELVRGSRVRFSGTVNRELGQLKMEFRAADTNSAPLNPEVKFAKKVFASAEIDATPFEGCILSWKDIHGLSCAAPREVKVAARDDSAPRSFVEGSSLVLAMLEDEVVDFKVRAEDDFGLKELWVNWMSDTKQTSGAAPITGSVVVSNGAPDKLELSGVYRFSPVLERVPEDTSVVLYSCSVDYLPGRTPSLSHPVRIHVLSRIKHAQMIEDRIRRLQARIEELARSEENRINENQKVREASEQERESAASTKKVAENSAAETADKEDLKRIASGVEDVLKDALRNKDIDPDFLRRWQENSDAIKTAADKSMAQASGELKKAAANAKDRADKLDKAIAHEQTALKAMRDIEKELNRSVEEMAAQSLVNRLKAASAEETKISGAIREILPQVIGIPGDRLKGEQRDKVMGIAVQQDGTGKNVKNIYDDLGGYFRRSGQKKFGEVRDAIAKMDTFEKLAQLSGKIRDNVGGTAIGEAESWSKTFKEWATMLEEAAGGKKGDGGGEGEKEMDEQTKELIIALVRARIAEETFREQTRLLDEKKTLNKSYGSDSVKLSGKQYELAASVRPLERKVKDQKVRQLLEKVGGEMMNAGMYLRKPQTDSDTIAIETEIIELLSASIASSAGGSGSGAAMARALGAMRGMGAGSAGGGNASPSEGVIAGVPVAGSTGGSETEGGKRVDVGNRIDVSLWPEEFKDVLEGYFRAMEEEK